MTDTDVKSTPLATKHVELGARMVPFAGWNMPVQYTGILDEHKAVRETCGIFDISHMGQFTVAGGSAAAWLNSMLTNDINKLHVGQGQYSVMLNDRAGVIDDLILYRMEPETFFVVVNASKIDEDFAWLSAHQPAGVTLENHSDEYVGLAVQGPECGEVFSRVIPGVELPPAMESPASRRKGRISLSAAPAIPGKMVLNSSARLRKASNGLKPFLEQEPNPAAWAPATACVWKCAIL